MRLSEGFKRYVMDKKYENDHERSDSGQRPYKNLFAYYRVARNFLADKYKNKTGKEPFRYE